MPTTTAARSLPNRPVRGCRDHSVVEMRVGEVEEGLVAHQLTLHAAHLQVPDLDRVVPRGRAHLCQKSQVTEIITHIWSQI